jgi:hypothetical protein
LQFERLSLFEPSMILTPSNRYGVSQGILLALTPLAKPLLCGPLRRYRGVSVEVLGTAIARNVISKAKGEEVLQWDDFHRLVDSVF